MFIPTYNEYRINEAKTKGDDYESAIAYYLTEEINNRNLFFKNKLTRKRVSGALLSQFENAKKDAENLLNELIRYYGDTLFFNEILDTGKENKARPLIISDGKIISKLTPGKDLADITIKSNKGAIYISLKFGTAMVALSNTGLGKLTEENTDELYKFIGVDSNFIASGLDEYSKQLYKRNIIK